MDLRVIVDYDKETKSYSAVCPELPGCTSCGDTQQEAMELYLEPDSKQISPSVTLLVQAVRRTLERDRTPVLSPGIYLMYL